MNPNIKKLYLFAALQGFILFYAFDKVFLLLRDLTLSQVVWINIIYIITILLFEVPSGALSDRWSRKYTLALSSIILAVYIAIFALSDSFLLFVIGSIIAGISSALLSGTNTSLMFDTLKQSRQERDYEKVLGRYRATRAITFVLAAIVGGYIGQKFGLETALWLSIPSVVMSAVIALSIKEPKFHRSTGEIHYWRHIAQTMSFLVKRPRFLHYIGLISAVLVAAMMVEEHSQLYYSYLGVSALGLGLLGAAASVIDGLFNTVAFWFKRFRHDLLYGVMLVLFSFGLLSTWLFQNWLGITLLLGSTLAFYVIEIIAMADINRQLPSKIRATSESFFSLCANLILLPILLAFGYISQTYTAAMGFMVIGLVLAGYTLFYWVSTVRSIQALGRIKQK